MSDRRLRTIVAVLSVAGIGVAGYLTYVHYADVQVLCLRGGGCETVQKSSYAKLAGVPVALLGLVGYVGLLGSLFVRGEMGRAAGALIAIVGFGFSAYLTYRELFTIHAICQWCVSSAVIITVLMVVTVVRLLRAPVAGGSAPAA
jgi:uncharacterized membrane protein